MIASLAFFVGAFMGGFLVTAVISWVIERFAFRDQEPNERAFATVGLAWLIVGTIAAFGFGNGGFAVLAYLYYAPGAFVYFLLYRRRLRRAWDEDAENFADVFE